MHNELEVGVGDVRLHGLDGGDSPLLSAFGRIVVPDNGLVGKLKTIHDVAVGRSAVLCCHQLKDCSAGSKVGAVLCPLSFTSVARVVKAVLGAGQTVHADQGLDVVLTGPAQGLFEVRISTRDVRAVSVVEGPITNGDADTVSESLAKSVIKAVCEAVIQG